MQEGQVPGETECFMAQKEIWYLVEQRIRDAKKVGSGNVVRECKVMAERRTVVSLE